MYDYRDAIVFRNLVPRVLSFPPSREEERGPWERGPQENVMPAKFFRLKSIFEKLRFRDGLVWTVGLTVELKLAFSNSSGGGRTLPKAKYQRLLELSGVTIKLVILLCNKLLEPGSISSSSSVVVLFCYF